MAALRALDLLTDPALASVFADAERMGSPSAWWGHVPFARWLVAACEPRVLVELGTHHGVSYAAFCSAVSHGGFSTVCHAVDTWMGDRHAGRYAEDVFEDFRAFHDARYADFSTLHRCTFDEARGRFEDGSVDLLHVDGLHTVEAVRHDVETWLSAMSERGVMVFHDTEVRRDDFGVWRLWEEVRSRYPSFHFRHGHGLGVLAVGAKPPPAIAALCALDAVPEGEVLRARFGSLGARWIAEAERMATARAYRREVEARQRADAEREQVASSMRRDARAAHAHMEALCEHAGHLERQLAAAIAEAAEARAHADAASRAHDAAWHAHLSELQRLRAIEAGVVWRATGPLRRFLDRHPTLRFGLRRVMRVGWWTVTGQLPARLRQRAAARGTLAPSMGAQVAFAPPASPAVAESASTTGDDPSVVPGVGEPVLIVPFDVPIAPLLPRPSIAVLLHAFHVQQAEDFRRRLAALPAPFTLFISTDTDEKAAELRRVFAAGPAERVTVRVFPNRGRDVAPKLVGFADVHADFDLVLHLHTKESPHEASLSAWRDTILDDLLGSREAIASIVEAFVRQPRLGIVAPRTLPAIRRHLTWGPNFPLARHVARRMGVTMSVDAPLDFPAGSMFWARGTALAPLLSVGLRFEDFPEEIGQRDGTLAHAIERLIFHACERAGFRWIRAGSDRALAAPEVPWRVYGPASLDALGGDQGPGLLLLGFRPNPTGAPLATAEASEALRSRFRKQCRDDLDAFLGRGDRFTFTPPAEPRVSVILLAFDQVELTFHCLEALHAEHPTAEVIILDNASVDRTGDLLSRVDGAIILRSPDNLGFVRGVNHAAAHAHGTYLLLLNNDTRVAPGAIDACIARLDAERDLGAVGGPIVLLDGTLQEAGSIIWRDGSTFGYGRGRDPGDPEFQFRRDVDYCSAAFLMVRRDLFERVGRFDEAFAPAYHEETDLCMRLRAEGYRVAYEPRARIMHVEFGSGTSTNAVALQMRNRATFLARHRATLATDHAPPETPPLLARARHAGRGRVLIIDDRVPLLALGSGYPRARQMIHALVDGGWAVTMLPLALPTVAFAEAYRAIPPSVEIAAGYGPWSLAGFLRARTGFFDAVIVSRPHNMTAFARAIAAAPDFSVGTKLVYDAEAIFATRDLIRAEQAGDPLARAAAARAITAELELARDAAVVFAVNEAEAERFRSVGCRDVRVLGHPLDPHPVGEGPSGRDGLLFVGAMDDDESPNVDSLAWFVSEVMPRLDTRIGEAWVLRAIGSHASPRVRRLASPRVQLLGRVEEIDDHYASARAFIAPTRFAAGIPLKVLEAAAKGLPVVATPLLQRQLRWGDGEECLVAGDADAFADACARLMRDDATWVRLRDGALRAVVRDADPERFRETLLRSMRANRDIARSQT